MWELRTRQAWLQLWLTEDLPPWILLGILYKSESAFLSQYQQRFSTSEFILENVFTMISLISCSFVKTGDLTKFFKTQFYAKILHDAIRSSRSIHATYFEQWSAIFMKWWDWIFCVLGTSMGTECTYTLKITAEVIYTRRRYVDISKKLGGEKEAGNAMGKLIGSIASEFASEEAISEVEFYCIHLPPPIFNQNSFLTWQKMKAWDGQLIPSL